jgi:hypothetical protein
MPEGEMDDVMKAELVSQTLEALSPAAEARAPRRLCLLVGAVPLPETTQVEADWFIRTRVQLAGECGPDRR